MHVYGAASSGFAWLSVVVKQRLTTLVPRKVVKADWEDNFGQLLMIVEPGFEGKVVDKILISPNERFADRSPSRDHSAFVSL